MCSRTLGRSFPSPPGQQRFDFPFGRRSFLPFVGRIPHVRETRWFDRRESTTCRTAQRRRGTRVCGKRTIEKSCFGDGPFPTQCGHPHVIAGFPDFHGGGRRTPLATVRIHGSFPDFRTRLVHLFSGERYQSGTGRGRDRVALRHLVGCDSRRSIPRQVFVQSSSILSQYHGSFRIYKGFVISFSERMELKQGRRSCLGAVTIDGHCICEKQGMGQITRKNGNIDGGRSFPPASRRTPEDGRGLV
mmetsp:Transcript_6434/g.15873  ORF Transcript_6434/g.15873 Transcript_6434/m.15873 type:complete len:245 (+) Transcript_6434:2334-3068(+)